MKEFVPQDSDSRDRIQNSIDETLFVEAGAGTGKTTSLVGRVMSLISSGKTTLDRIAAITFTEAAAAELRDRIRERLEKAADDSSLPENERELYRRGVEDLDQASIRTLHSFAMTLLRERPIEAGLPPAFEIMDQISGDLAFDEKWTEWLDAALEDTELVRPLEFALSLGMSIDNLRDIARNFHENYDLLIDASFDTVSMPAPVIVEELVRAIPLIEDLCRCSKLGEDDKLFEHVQEEIVSIRSLSEMRDSGSASAYRFLQRMMPIKKGNAGRQRDWEYHSGVGENACKYLKDYLNELDGKAVSELKAVRQAALIPLLAAIQKFALDFADDRKKGGRANFHDLLVWARNLLRDDIGVRDYFINKFSHLLIDEAQDTDPIQAEIAMFLAEDSASNIPDCSRPRKWDEIVPKRGKLFVVGDPKQSIYRFRRADVRQMELLRERMGGETLRLVQNFRSQQPIIEWVNRVFGDWMRHGSDLQAEYADLLHRWGADTDESFAPAVWSLGHVIEEKVAHVRKEEARGIVELIAHVVRDKWRILDRSESESAGVERYKSARYSDICILMNKRIALSDLEIELDDAEIPYRLEGGSLVFSTQEVRDSMNCLRAIDDPADSVAVVAALRSPAFACSDAALLDFYESGGRFDYLRKSNLTDGAVGKGLSTLREYHEKRMWTPLAYLIDGFIRSRPFMQVAVDDPRMRQKWRRYRFVVDQARAFENSGGNSLRAFLSWMERQVDERARLNETPVPESDEDAVRIMTVHGAKGLEFPIVVLTGIVSDHTAGSGVAVLFDREYGAAEARVSAGRGGEPFETAGYDRLNELEKKLEKDELARLMYVAATRARDHLVVSVYRAGDDKGISGYIVGILADTDDAGDADDAIWKPVLFPSAGLLSKPESSLDDDEVFRLEDHTLEARERWVEERAALIQRLGRPASISATALARIEKQEQEPEPEAKEPWKRGRAGTSIGRAVHAVLQTVDLGTGAGIDETARAQANAESVRGREVEIARLARSAVESDIVRRAVASGRFWREAPMIVPIGGGVLEGYIDLLFEEDGGIVIVDYKTDSVTASEARKAAARYEMQAGAYALMAQRATKKQVVEVVFLFLQPRSEQRFANIDYLAAKAEAAAASGLRIGV